MTTTPTDAPPLGFWKIAETYPDHLALVDPDEREISAGELLSSCNQLVHGLRALGLQPGDAIAMLLPNCAEVFELYLAVGQAGFYLIPINWHLVGPEIAYIVRGLRSQGVRRPCPLRRARQGRGRRDRLPRRRALRDRRRHRLLPCRTRT